MFDKDILIVGKHAKYIKDLAQFEKTYDGNQNLNLFDRYIDVYIAGAIIGITYGIKSDIDKESEYKSIQAKIMLSAIMNEKEILEYIYRLVMLLDKESDVDIDSRINRAFREDSTSMLEGKHKENQQLFLKYVLGGIEKLHEQVFDTNNDTAINNMFDFFDDWQIRFNIDPDDIELKDFC